MLIGKKEKVLYDPSCKENLAIFKLSIKHNYNWTSNQKNKDDVNIIINSNLFKNLNAISIDEKVFKKLKNNMLRLAIKNLKRNTNSNIKISTTLGIENDDVETKKFHDDMHKFLIFNNE